MSPLKSCFFNYFFTTDSRHSMVQCVSHFCMISPCHSFVIVLVTIIMTVCNFPILLHLSSTLKQHTSILACLCLDDDSHDPCKFLIHVHAYLRMHCNKKSLQSSLYWSFSTVEYNIMTSLWLYTIAILCS